MTDSLIGQYRALEWALIPIPAGSKAPVAKEWAPDNSPRPISRPAAMSE
jgi:hypothetical protein